MSFALVGCAQNAVLERRYDHGGVVVYPFKETGAVLSPFRRDALRLMEEHCRGGYRIVREGETRGRSRVSEHVGGADVIEERRWGIEFECKGP
ncbi:hypothetical protein [Candidatus Nitrospira bockiana]